MSIWYPHGEMFFFFYEVSLVQAIVLSANHDLIRKRGLSSYRDVIMNLFAAFTPVHRLRTLDMKSLLAAQKCTMPQSFGSFAIFATSRCALASFLPASLCARSETVARVHRSVLQRLCTVRVPGG